MRFYACGDIDPLVDTEILNYEYYIYTYFRDVFSIKNKDLIDKIKSDEFLG